MKHTEIINEFMRFIGINSIEEMKEMAIDEAFRKYIEFYKSSTIEGVMNDIMSDAILFQWGTFDWGKGNNTNIDLTRQVILNDDSLEDDDKIIQISLVYQYEPAKELEDLGMSNMWFEEKEFVDDIYEEFDETKVIETAKRYEVKNILFTIETV